MTAGPLFVVVDEDVVPGEGAHVEGVQRAKDPHERGAKQTHQKYVDSFPEIK